MCKKTLLLSLLCIVFLSSCASTVRPSSISEEEAKNISQKYFLNKYSIDTTYISIDEVRVGEHEYVNRITVNYESSQYELCLDPANKPLCDNKVELDKENGFAKEDFLDDYLSLDLFFRESDTSNTTLYYQESRYKFIVVAATDIIPLYENKDEMYSVLKKLESSGVDGFLVLINTPQFLRQGMWGLQLGGMFFDTNLSETAFEAKYKELVDMVYYDEKKFDDIIQILRNEGIDSPHFVITNYRIDTSRSRITNGAALELNLYSKSADIDSIELIKKQLEKIDDSYFYLKDTKIGLTIVIEKDGEFEEIIYR